MNYLYIVYIHELSIYSMYTWIKLTLLPMSMLLFLKQRDRLLKFPEISSGNHCICLMWSDDIKYDGCIQLNYLVILSSIMVRSILKIKEVHVDDKQGSAARSCSLTKYTYLYILQWHTHISLFLELKINLQSVNQLDKEIQK